jgi:hypothetical protein
MEPMELTEERKNEIAYALLLIVLSKQEVQLDPDLLKRKLGNLPQQLRHLPEQLRNISQEEIQAASKIIFHDLVDYAWGFTLKSDESKK